MISFARDGEDVVLARALGRGPGIYLDVGCGSPDVDSVTRHFYEAGWHGISIDPLPEWADQHRASRSRDLVIEAAAGERTARALLYRMRESPADSTLSEEIAEHHLRAGLTVDQLNVDVRTLDDILEEADPPYLDFLRVGAAGAEYSILAGLNLNRWRPRVVVVALGPRELGLRAERYEQLLDAAQYRFASDDGANRYYVRDEDALLLPLLSPATSRDGYVRATEQALEEEVAALRRTAEGLRRAIERGSPQISTNVGEAEEGVEASLPSPADDPEILRLVELDRIAVISAPETGSHQLSALLGHALGLVPERVEHPADLAWAELPDRVLLELSWPYSDRLRSLLASRGFRVLTVGRDPLDLLIALLAHLQPHGRGTVLSPSTVEQLVGELPTGDAFLAWAESEEAASLLGLSADWWQEPMALRVRYDMLVKDPAKVVDELLVDLAVGPRPLYLVAAANEAAVGLDDFDEVGAWRSVLDRSSAERLLAQYGGLFARLGLEVLPPPAYSDVEHTSATWRRLCNRATITVDN